MNRQEILEGNNDLIDGYEDISIESIDEVFTDISYSLERLKIECEELREEIKQVTQLLIYQ